MIRGLLAGLAAMALAGGCVTGCVTGSSAGRATARQKRATQRALAGISTERRTIRPKGPAASFYGAPVQHALSPPERAIADRLRRLSLRHMPALSRMTRELVATAPDRVNIPPALVDGLMAWAGLVDPSPRLIVVEMPADRDGCARRYSAACAPAVDSLLQQIRATMPDSRDVYFGVGVTALPDGATRMMVAVLEHAVRLEAVPTAVTMDQPVNLRGKLLGPRRRPSVEVVDPRGTWRKIPIRVEADGSFSADVGCATVRGAHQIEVLAEGQHGPEVVANFPVQCGRRPPQDIDVVVERLARSVTPAQIALANLAYLNEAREARGLAPVVWDDAAARVAEAHSRDMQRNGFVGHVSPTTGDVSARFARAGLQGAVIRENVARGYGPKGIHDSLMRSPGHRINLLADDVTHVGIGVVIAPPETNVAGAPRPLYASQNFFRKPGAGAPAATRDLAPTMRRKVDKDRSSARKRAVDWDDGLAKVAQRLAAAVARGKPLPAGWDKEVFALGYKTVDAHQVASPDFEALARTDVWDERGAHLGIGIARGRTGDRPFLMIVLVAR